MLYDYLDNRTSIYINLYGYGYEDSLTITYKYSHNLRKVTKFNCKWSKPATVALLSCVKIDCLATYENELSQNARYVMDIKFCLAYCASDIIYYVGSCYGNFWAPHKSAALAKLKIVNKLAILMIKRGTTDDPQD